MYLQVGGVVARVVRAVVGLAGLAALVEHLHPGLEHIELLPVLPRFRAAALEFGLHVVPEEPRHRVLLVDLVVADGLLQLALGHLDLVAKVEEHDEDAAGRGTEEHEKDDDVGPYGENKVISKVYRLTIWLNLFRFGQGKGDRSSTILSPSMHLLVHAAPQNPRKVKRKRNPKTVMTMRMSEKWSAVEFSWLSSGTISKSRISLDCSRRYTHPPTTAREQL